MSCSASSSHKWGRSVCGQNSLEGPGFVSDCVVQCHSEAMYPFGQCSPTGRSDSTVCGTRLPPFFSEWAVVFEQQAGSGSYIITWVWDDGNRLWPDLSPYAESWSWTRVVGGWSCTVRRDLFGSFREPCQWSLRISCVSSAVRVPDSTAIFLQTQSYQGLEGLFKRRMSLRAQECACEPSQILPRSVQPSSAPKRRIGGSGTPAEDVAQLMGRPHNDDEGYTAWNEWVLWFEQQATSVCGLWCGLILVAQLHWLCRGIHFARSRVRKLCSSGVLMHMKVDLLPVAGVGRPSLPPLRWSSHLGQRKRKVCQGRGFPGLCWLFLYWLHIPHCVWAVPGGPPAAAALTGLAVAYVGVSSAQGGDIEPDEPGHDLRASPGSSSAEVEWHDGDLPVHLAIPHYQPLYGETRVARGEMPDAFLMRVRGMFPGEPLELFDCISPVEPVPQQGATFVAYSSVLDSLDMAAVLIDLTACGGTQFAAVLPHQLGQEAWRTYLVPTLCGIVEFDCYVGMEHRPHDGIGDVVLQHGALVVVGPRGFERPPARRYEIFLHLPELWSACVGAPTVRDKPAFCLMFGDERWILRKREFPRMGLHSAAAACVALPEEETTIAVAHRPPVEDLCVHAEHCCALAAILNRPPPLPVPPARAHRPDTFIFLDARPFGVRPNFVYQEEDTWELEDLLRAVGIVIPPGFAVSVTGGVQRGSRVIAQNGDTVRLCPVSLRSDDSVEGDESSESSSGDSSADEPDDGPDGDDRVPAPRRNRQVVRPRSRSPRRLGFAGCTAAGSRFADGGLAFKCDQVCNDEDHASGQPDDTPVGRTIVVSEDVDPHDPSLPRTASLGQDIPAEPNAVCDLEVAVPVQVWRNCLFSIIAPLHRVVSLQVAMPFPCVPAQALNCLCQSISQVGGSAMSQGFYEPVPLAPQVDSDRGSVALIPVWVEAAGKQIIVLDMRPLDGPLYATIVVGRMNFWDVQQEAERHHLSEWNAYAFGQSSPLQPNVHFLAIKAGVIRFVPKGELPAWAGRFVDRLDRPNMWAAGPAPPVESPAGTVLIVQELGATSFASERRPGQEVRSVAADLLGHAPNEVLLISPHKECLDDVTVHGKAYEEVVAVYPIQPLISRQGKFVFLDTRQVGVRPGCVYLPGDELVPETIVGRLGVQPPPCFCLSVLPLRPGAALQAVRDGDVFTVGFRQCRQTADGTVDEASDVAGGVGDGSHKRSATKGLPARMLPWAIAAHFVQGSQGCTAAWAWTAVDGVFSVGFGSMESFRASRSVPPGIMWETRLLAEPTGCAFASADFDALRVVTVEMGHDWPYFPPEGRALPPGAAWLQEVELTEGDEITSVSFAVLVPEYLQEAVTVDVGLPLSVDEVIAAVRGSRSAQREELFPYVAQVCPQPGRGWGVLIALPHWARFENVLCFDLSGIGGVFSLALFQG